MPNRRNVLIGLGGALAVAGCTGETEDEERPSESASEPEPEPEPEPEREWDSDESEPEPEEETESDELNSGSNGESLESRAVSFLEDVSAAGFDGELIDVRGQNEITIDVGSGPNGLQFGPPMVIVDVGTTVVWRWTGEGGSHNVVSDSDSDFGFESSRTDQQGFTFTEAFDEEGVAMYVCTPHRAQAMYGAVVVTA